MMQSLRSSIFCVSATIAVASSLAFALYSEFLAATPTGVFRCKELASSGADDELATVYFMLLLPSILIRIVRWTREVAQFEAVLFLASLAGAGACVFLSLDCGNFFFTTLSGPDPYLVSLQFFSLVAVGALTFGTRPKHG